MAAMEIPCRPRCTSLTPIVAAELELDWEEWKSCWSCRRARLLPPLVVLQAPAFFPPLRVAVKGKMMVVRPPL